MTLLELVPILQTAVGPAVLISGVGLLLLTMTNRLGRVIDRARQLAHGLRTARPADRAAAEAQLAILLRRARIIRAAIALAILSALSAAALVITLFAAAVFLWDVPGLVVGLFVACLAALIAALVAFLRDINLSLVALKLEVRAHRDAAP